MTQRSSGSKSVKAAGNRASPTAKLRYAFDTSMSRGPSALLGYLGLATVLMIVLFAAIHLIFGLSGNGNPITALYQALLHSIDSGTVAGDTGNGNIAVNILLTFGGIIVFSAFIGVLATTLDDRLADLRKGRSAVLETDHTLILGWSERVFTIVSELCVANESETKPSIVILAERDKVEMDDAIRERVGDTRNTRVVCRTGKPISVGDLELVNHHEARSVIVLGQDDVGDPDANVIKAILALTTSDEHAAGRHIVAELQRARNLDVARLAGGDQVVLIDKPETVSRLIVQTSRQSGAAAVYRELLAFEGDEVYMRADASLVGRTFRDALHAYEDCSVIGLLHADGSLKLNVPADTVLADGDQVIAVAEDDSILEVAPPSAGTVEHARIVLTPDDPPTPDVTLILGYNHRAPLVISELSDYAPEGSRVDVVCDVPVDESVLTRVGGPMGVTVRQADTTDRDILDELQITQYDRVIVLGYSDDLESAHADARSLMTLLHLRDIAQRTGGDFTIVSEILDEEDTELAKVANVDDIVVSDQILSLMLAQLSENRHLADVFAELFQADGAEIYLRPVERYVTPGPVSFATLVEAAAQRGETALGYRSGAHARDSDNGYGIIVNPPKSDVFDAADGDRLVVLAED